MRSGSRSENRVVRVDGELLALLYQIADEYGVSLRQASEIVAQMIREKKQKVFPSPEELF